jgi:hypothetical protein
VRVLTRPTRSATLIHTGAGQVLQADSGPTWRGGYCQGEAPAIEMVVGLSSSRWRRHLRVRTALPWHDDSLFSLAPVHNRELFFSVHRSLPRSVAALRRTNKPSKKSADSSVIFEWNAASGYGLFLVLLALVRLPVTHAHTYTPKRFLR